MCTWKVSFRLISVIDMVFRCCPNNHQLTHLSFSFCSRRTAATYTVAVERSVCVCVCLSVELNKWIINIRTCHCIESTLTFASSVLNRMKMKPKRERRKIQQIRFWHSSLLLSLCVWNAAYRYTMLSMHKNTQKLRIFSNGFYSFFFSFSVRRGHRRAKWKFDCAEK